MRCVQCSVVSFFFNSDIFFITKADLDLHVTHGFQLVVVPVLVVDVLVLVLANTVMETSL